MPQWLVPFIRNTISPATTVFATMKSALLLAALLLSLPAVAGDYFVATTGSDSNPGSITLPFQTLAKAATIANAGDTIYLRGGTYALTSGIKLSKSGSSGNRINIFAYQAEVPVLDASAMTQTGYYAGWVLWLADVSWVHVNGLEIKKGPMGGVVITGASHNNIIEKLNVHHNGRLSQWEGKGISLYGSSANNLVVNNDAHHNVDLQQSNADGFQISTSGAGNVLRGNRAWRNSDDGYDFFNIFDNSFNAALLLENNWAYENGFDDTLQPTAGDGNGFKLGGRRANTTGNSGGHTLNNNVSWGNLVDGFDENDASDPMTLNHNTGFNNGNRNFAFWTTPHVFHNNVSAGSLGVSICCGAGSSIVDHNSWTLPVTVSSADFISVDSSLATGPRAGNGALPSSNFLHLTAGSDLIDTGVNVGLAYAGSAPDLGAYETAAVPTGDITPPSVPTGLVATATSATAINLVWTASTDNVAVVGYGVYRNSAKIAETSATTYSTTGLVANTSYSFQVRALDAAGNASALTASVSAKTWKFASGSRVKTTGKVTVRSGPGTSYSSTGTQTRGKLGTVVGNPVLSSGYYWWNINFDAGADGWVREDSLGL